MPLALALSRLLRPLLQLLLLRLQCPLAGSPGSSRFGLLLCFLLLRGRRLPRWLATGFLCLEPLRSPLVGAIIAR